MSLAGASFFDSVLKRMNWHRELGQGEITMKVRRCAAPMLLALALLAAGCASTKVLQQTPPSSAELSRPNMIWVYDFAATPEDIPADSSIRSDLSTPSTPPSPQQVEAARKLGVLIAGKLVADIQAMGMPATEAGPASSPAVGDCVIRGYIVSAEGGGAGGTIKRMVIGFGSGTAELDTVVEGYVMTANGLRKLGSGTLTSAGTKMPGLVVPAAVVLATGNPVGLIVVGGVKIAREVSGANSLDARAKATAEQIAVELKIRFQDRGWIPAS